MLDAKNLRPHIAANLKRFRTKRGWTQKQLGELLGITEVQVNRIEKANSTPSVELLYAMADLFGVPADTFRMVTEKISVA